MDIPYYTSKVVGVSDPWNPPLPEPVSGLPYTFVVFSRYNTEYGSGLLQHTVQSKYPPFVCDSARGNPAVFVYANGHDCFRITSYWYLTNSREGDVPTCYLKNLTLFFRPVLTAGNLFGTLLRSTVENYEEVDFLIGSQPIDDYPSVIDETTVDDLVVEKCDGYHAVFINGVPKTNVLISNSSWVNPSGTSSGQYDLAGARVVTRAKIQSSTYQISTMLTDFDYRIIQGMPFQSGSEWLAWCKEH